jgi:hypothetical protein
MQVLGNQEKTVRSTSTVVAKAEWQNKMIGVTKKSYPCLRLIFKINDIILLKEVKLSQ